MFKRNGVWWIAFRYNGRKVRKSLGTPDRKLAGMIESKLRLEVAKGEYFEGPKEKPKTVAEMMDRFMVEHAPKVEPNTQLSYAATLKHLLPYFGLMQLSEVHPKHLSAYKAERLRKCKPASLNRELAMLSKAYNLAVREWEWAISNPVSRISKERENNARIRWLSHEEEALLVCHSEGWFANIIKFASRTGLRKGELINLRWRDVDMAGATIRIPDSKNGEPRTIPLEDIAFGILQKRWAERRLGSDNLVFLTPSGKRLDGSHILRVLRRVCIKAGITDLHFHDCRHTYGSRLAHAGVDIYTIMKLMGHKDMRMTMRYVHLNVESLKSAVSKMSDKSVNSGHAGHNLDTVTTSGMS